jgi:hypothetical protein
VITFESVQKQLPDVVGRMVFDREQMKWVKAPGASGAAENEQSSNSSERSADVFAGLDSLREETEPTPTPPKGRGGSDQADDTATEASFGNATRSPERVDFSQSRSATASHTDMATAGATAGNISQLSLSRPSPSAPSVHIVKPSFDRSFQFPLAQPSEAPPQQSDRTPGGKVKSNPTGIQVTPPVSVLKKRIQVLDPSTPVNIAANGQNGGSAERRSVSFSDGRKSGKMLDARVHQEPAKQRRPWNDLAARTGTPTSISGLFDPLGHDASERPSLAASMRTSRIRDMVDAMDDSGAQDRSRGSYILQLTIRLPAVGDSVTPSKRPTSSSSRSLTRSESDESADNTNSDAVYNRLRFSSKRNPADATFLTECSFAVAHDKLVELITEVQPFEPHWELLTRIDLSNRGADSVARLKEFLPKLDEAILLVKSASPPLSCRLTAVGFDPQK